MRIPALQGLTIGCITLLLSAGALAEEPRWRLFGSNELMIENYHVSGDESASPYRFEDTFITNRTNFRLELDTDLGRTFLVRGEVVGTDSDYFKHDGLFIGTLKVELEDGAGAVPYRLGAGDVFADLSRRLLQRNVRGFSAEVQPNIGWGDHSVLVVSGSGEPDWRDTFDDGGDIYFNGLSWLAASSDGRTSLVANVIEARQSAGAEGAFPIPLAKREQWIAGLYGETELAFARLEGEVSLLDGDEGDGTLEDTSFYGQLTDEKGAFAWRVRLEQNGEEYRPIGAVGIIPNYRIGEAHVRYQPALRHTFRGRLQHIENNFEGSLAELQSDVAAFTYESRPLGARPLFRLMLSGDINAIESDDRSRDELFQMWTVELSDRLPGRLDLSLRGQWKSTDSDVLAIPDRELAEQMLSLGRTFQGRLFQRRLQGRIRGGVIHREQDDAGAYESWNPMFEAMLTAGTHSLALHLGFQDQDFEPVSIADLEYQTERLTYSWTPGNHGVYFEVGNELREPDGRRETESRRMALRYRYMFDRRF